MESILEAIPSSGTNTAKRDWTDTETAFRGEKPGREVQDEAEGDSLVDPVQGPSGSNVFVIVVDGIDEFITPAFDDSESAILDTPGADLSSRLRHVLPFISSCEPLVEALRGEVVGRLLSYDAPISAPRGRQSSPIQVKLSADKWMAQVRAWASSFPQRDYVVDDSRESSYGDRV